MIITIGSERGRKGRGRGSAEGADADGEGDAESDGSEGDASADDDRPRKRGRPPASHREKIKGFTDQEVIFLLTFWMMYDTSVSPYYTGLLPLQIRKFVKSYKKFSAPLKHLDSIACDAELQEKPLAELKKLGEILEERCKAVLNDTSETTSKWR